MLARVDTERVGVDPSAHTENAGGIDTPSDLIEGTIGVDEQIPVVRTASATPASADGDAVVESGEDRLIVMNDEPTNTAVGTGARGVFLSIIGVSLGLGGITVLTTTLAGVV